jgi:hypothetical protein
VVMRGLYATAPPSSDAQPEADEFVSVPWS